eukprot:3896065-Amphidinium_carterae.1
MSSLIVVGLNGITDSGLLYDAAIWLQLLGDTQWGRQAVLIPQLIASKIHTGGNTGKEKTVLVPSVSGDSRTHHAQTGNLEQGHSV